MSRNIVILGAGFGGVRCALNIEAELRRYLRGSTPEAEEWKVVLVDRNDYHLYSPRLYEFIVPSRNTYHVARSTKCAVGIKEILKGTKVEFVQGEVRGVDCNGREVVVDGTRIPYGYLVLALGAGTDYFGIPGLQEYACTLKSVEDAERIREKIGEFLKEVQDPHLISPLARGRKRGLSIVIGGAGATGVEIAAELAYLFRKVPRELWSVTLVEALSSVLWMFPKAVGEYADKRLRELGVHVMLDTCIKSAQKNCVTLAPRPLKAGETEAALACDFLPKHEKRMRADLLLWAGGIRANPLISQCGLTVDRKGRVEVDEHLQVKGMLGMFALGDNATLINPETKQPVPATAQAALEQGRLVAENVVRLMKAGDLVSEPSETKSPHIQLRAYWFHDFSAIVPLADRDGVALTGKLVWRGWLAWLLRKVADLRYYWSIK